jgi:hypothetical protein
MPVMLKAELAAVRSDFFGKDFSRRFCGRFHAKFLDAAM